MSHAPLLRNFRLLALACVCSGLLNLAHADEYGDVNQLLKSGKSAEALARADQYLAAKPRDPQMRFIKGVIHRDSGKTSEAIATFTKLTEDYPELPEPYNNLAVLYAGQGQVDKARAALEMAIRTNPSYATAHENLGDVYAKLASQAYNKALQLDTSNTAVQPKLLLIRELFNPAPKATPNAQTPASPTFPTAAVNVHATSPVPAVQSAAIVASAPPSVVAPPAQLVSPAPKAKTENSDVQAAEDAQAAILSWAKAWSAKDVTGYLAAYGKDFTPPGKQSRSAWEHERRKRISEKSNISVKLENLKVSVRAEHATATFRQNYRADTLMVSSRKTMDLMKVGHQWLIVREATGN